MSKSVIVLTVLIYPRARSTDADSAADACAILRRYADALDKRHSIPARWALRIKRRVLARADLQTEKG